MLGGRDLSRRSVFGILTGAVAAPIVGIDADVLWQLKALRYWRLVQSGEITPNEWRAAWGLAPVVNGNLALTAYPVPPSLLAAEPGNSAGVA